MSFDLSGWITSLFTKDQVANVLPAATKPIFLVQLNYSGTVEYLSCHSSVTYDGDAYTEGGISISKIKNQDSATLSFPATAARVTGLIDQDWRRGQCDIYYIPAAPADGMTFVDADGVLLIPGIIDSATVSGGVITLTVINQYLTGVMCPGIIFNQFCNHIPAAGTSITWEGETDVLESGLVLGPGIR